MQAIGIDLGTTSICGVVLDTATGEVLRVLNKNSDAFLPAAHDYEKIQDAETIINIAFEILHALLTEETSVIGVTGQMHGIVYVNTAGKAVSPLYTWQDSRGNLPYRGGKTYAGHLGSYTGYGNVTDFYNRENGLRPAEAVSYCTIQDYFVMRLCQKNEPLVHTSNAASFGNFDPESKCFSYDCPVAVADGYVLAGTYNEIPVSVAIGDNQAGVLATAKKEDVLINVGTGSQISVIGDRIVQAKNVETRPFFEGQYLLVGAALCGGRAYALLKEFYRQVFAYRTSLTDDELYDIMGQMVQKAKNAWTVDTRFAGTRAEENIKGSVTGIDPENFTPEAMTAGVLNGIIAELVQMYAQMGTTKTNLVGSGNGIRKNKFLVRVAERLMNMPMQIPVYTEEAAVGAAMYAAIACGLYRNMQHAADTVIRYR